ncbi:hypothetical protein ACHAXR_003922, partial [Thalassiosira sp. AJA248-18]
ECSNVQHLDVIPSVERVPSNISGRRKECQKRINAKLLLQGPQYETFDINGISPLYSTPKPVRFIIAERDAALATGWTHQTAGASPNGA